MKEKSFLPSRSSQSKGRPTGRQAREACDDLLISSFIHRVLLGPGTLGAEGEESTRGCENIIKDVKPHLLSGEQM